VVIAGSMAPPGCNRPEVRKSWVTAARAVRRRLSGRAPERKLAPCTRPLGLLSLSRPPDRPRW
jgi:hypothetical protein